MDSLSPNKLLDPVITAPTYGERHPGLILLLLCMAQFMVVLDFSIVNVALPAMQHDLGFSQQNLQWVVSAYSLTFGGLLLLGGRLADLLGHRLILVIGLICFSLASLAGGLAQSAAWLILARAVQGLGGALVAPTAIALIVILFAEGSARNKALGVVGAVASSGFAAGAILGGLLTAGPGWRWVMFVNVPIGIAVIVLALLLLPRRSTQAGQRNIDIWGAVLVTASLVALVYALTEGNSFGWLSLQTLGLLAFAALALVAFIIVEARSKAPLVRLSIFRVGNVTGANLVSFFAIGAFGSLIFVLTLFMQQVLGFSALVTGLAFLPIAGVLILITNLMSRLVTRIGLKRIIVGGQFVMVVGALLLLSISVGGSFVTTLLPGMLVFALGIGSTFATIIIAATAGISNDEQGLATGLLNTTQQVGAGVGLAVIVALSSGRTTSLLQQGHIAFNVARTEGFHYALIGCACLAFISGLVALLTIHEKQQMK